MSLSIIHLSDVHINKQTDFILSKAQSVYNACSYHIDNCSTVVIVVSGDIVFSGLKEQYNLAEKFFDELKSYIEQNRNSTVEFVFSAGNHDCNFQKNDSIRETLISSLSNSDPDNAHINNIISVQDNYFDFVSKYHDTYAYENPNVYAYEKKLSINNNELLFVSVNTAWMSELNEYPGRIIIPTAMLPYTRHNTSYKVVIYSFHHPINWLHPDKKMSFIQHLRNQADFILLGHEHTKDNYSKIGDDFAIIYNHGKELQNTETKESGFSIIKFNDELTSYSVYDYAWDNEKNIYSTLSESLDKEFKSNRNMRSVFSVNETFNTYTYDLGADIHHPTKQQLTLDDIFIWPDLNKTNAMDSNYKVKKIAASLSEEISSNPLCIIYGESGIGKTSLCKLLFRSYVNKSICTIFIDGKDLKASNRENLLREIEQYYKEQYSADQLESYKQLPAEQKILIIDNFDSVNYQKQTTIIDSTTGLFKSIILTMDSTIEMSSILQSNFMQNMDNLFLYEICPFGNMKRKDFIKNWYTLNNVDGLNEIDTKVENAKATIDQFLGNGASFIPALPIVLASILQNTGAFRQTTHNNKYSYLYETLINQSLASVKEYKDVGLHSIDTAVLQILAYNSLNNKKTFFKESDIKSVLKQIAEEMMLDDISFNNFIGRMSKSKMLLRDTYSSETYKFCYPYIFYYFSAKYMVNHLDDKDVNNLMEYMSCNLHNEVYGNVITFICYFNNSSTIIDDILLNAYDTLEEFSEFDYSKHSQIFDAMKNAVCAYLPKHVPENDGVEHNKDLELRNLDDIGYNDGKIANDKDYIESDLSNRTDNINAISAAFRTIDVLGQILTNYPGSIDGSTKLQIINEIHSLGLRAVTAIVQTMGYLGEDLINKLYENSKKNNTYLSKSEIQSKVNSFLNLIIAGMARMMIHQVAKSFSSNLLLRPVEISFHNSNLISAKLLFVDLKVNCLNQVDYRNLKEVRDSFEKENEFFALGIFDSIIGRYLCFNKCDHTLRSKLSKLCGFSETAVLIKSQLNRQLD